jgi:hypothetical protein
MTIAELREIQKAEKPTRRNNHAEDDHQATVIAWARLNERKFPALRWLFHVPNGGKRSAREAARLQRQGVIAGVADLFLPYRSRDFHGLFIELKAEGGRLTDNQRAFLQAMTAHGYCAQVAVGSKAAIELIKWYLGVENER